MSAIVCSGLLIATFSELFQAHWREAAAWFIQIVAVWTALYVGYLSCTFRSGQEFEKEAKGNIISSLIGIAVLPLFWVWPFLTLVLRSIVSQFFFATFLHYFRPVKIGWCLPLKEFLSLVKRGIRLYTGTYLRYSFWLTVEIWLMFQIAGDKGVGLLVFSKMIAESITQLPIAINQVYIPRIAQKFGQTSDIAACLRFSHKPTIINLGISAILILMGWSIIPTVINYVFPKYQEAIPILLIYLLQTLIVSLSIPLYMVAVLESYLTQITAAGAGLLIFVVVSLGLHSVGFDGTAVAWGSLAGQVIFAATCLISINRKARARACYEL